MRVIEDALGVPVARGRGASHAQIAELVHVEAVLAWRDAPDVTPDLKIAVRLLHEIDRAAQVVLLLWVLEHALGVDIVAWGGIRLVAVSAVAWAVMATVRSTIWAIVVLGVIVEQVLNADFPVIVLLNGVRKAHGESQGSSEFHSPPLTIW